MTLSCIVVEDEPLAVTRLTGYIAKLPSLSLLGTFSTAIDALSFLQTNQVDLVFLDIRLGGMSGIELLETQAVKGQVILTSAHQEHALKAYDLKVTDYLLKPFTFARFVQAVDRAHERGSLRENGADRRFIFVKTELRLEKVNLGQILYIEGMRDYRQVRTTVKRIMTLETFVDFEQRLPRDVICRVHKSFMVSIERIETIEKDQIKIADALIPVSDTYREAFYALINRRSR